MTSSNSLLVTDADDDEATGEPVDEAGGSANRDDANASFIFLTLMLLCSICLDKSNINIFMVPTNVVVVS